MSIRYLVFFWKARKNGVAKSYPCYPQKFGADYRIKDLFLKDIRGYYRRSPLSLMVQEL